MEIISYVLEGALEHKDSIGTGSVIRPGDVQRMSAGTGDPAQRVQPLEDRARAFPADLDPAGATRASPPSYEQKTLRRRARSADRLRLVASPDGRDGSVTIHQDAEPLRGVPRRRTRRSAHALAAGRHAWIQVARGAVAVNGKSLQAGDGAAASELPTLKITGATDGTEILLFDLP